LTFKITDENGNALRNAEVTFEGITYTPDPNGKLTVTGVYGDTHSYTVSVSGYSHVTGSLTVSNSDVPVTVSLWGTTYNAVFTVNDGTNPISGANVYFNGSAYITDSNGQIFISKVANGSYVYLVSSSGYADATGNLKINSANNSKTVSLNKVNYSVTFTVTDGTIPVSGASITIDGATYTTSPKGQVFITNIANGTFSYTITASDYNNYTGTITISDADI
jgi:hypothetical protein